MDTSSVRTDPSDDDLLTAFRAGNRHAFEELFERYRQPVWAFFARRLGESARAEELAQDVFVAVIEGAHRYEPRGAFRSYLFGIAYRTLLAARRVARHEVAAGHHDVTGTDPDPTLVMWVRTAIAALDDTDREVLMLREYEQLRYDEIAAVLGTPLNSVRTRLFRARAALRAQLLGRAESRRA
jgi:RNA polymerase sigma-70 factor (ECF subfamily)